MQRKHVGISNFRKQYHELLSLNNIHVGAKLNRDQIINKSIQNTMKMLLKNRKTLEITTVEAAQKRKLTRGPLGARLPRAQAAAWAWAGKEAPAWFPVGPNLG